MTMTDLPSIFNAYGTFIKISDEAQDALSDAQRAVYEKLKQGADNLNVAELAVVAAIEHVKSCFDAVTEFENFMRKTLPKMTFHDLWKQTVKGQ
jgi:hypothetical protein